MKANARRRREGPGGDDSGQLLILAGVILVMAFMMSVLTVHELSAQQQRTAAGPQSPLPDVFRELRDRVAGTLNGLTYAGIDDATFRVQFSATQADAQRLADRHAAQLVLRLADRNDTLAPKNESLFVSGGKYTAWSYNGSRDFTAINDDLGADGILHNSTYAIRGAILYMVLADPGSRMEETFVIAVQ